MRNTKLTFFLGHQYLMLRSWFYLFVFFCFLIYVHYFFNPNALFFNFFFIAQPPLLTKATWKQLPCQRTVCNWEAPIILPVLPI